MILCHGFNFKASGSEFGDICFFQMAWRWNQMFLFCFGPESVLKSGTGDKHKVTRVMLSNEKSLKTQLQTNSSQCKAKRVSSVMYNVCVCVSVMLTVTSSWSVLFDLSWQGPNPPSWWNDSSALSEVNHTTAVSPLSVCLSKVAWETPS